MSYLGIEWRECGPRKNMLFFIGRCLAGGEVERRDVSVIKVNSLIRYVIFAQSKIVIMIILDIICKLGSFYFSSKGCMLMRLSNTCSMLDIKLRLGAQQDVLVPQQ